MRAAASVLAALLLCCLAQSGHATNKALEPLLGRWEGHCIQNAYEVKPFGTFKCSKSPVTYPYYITVGKDKDSKKYWYSYSQDAVTIKHGKTTLTRNARSGSKMELGVVEDWMNFGGYKCFYALTFGGDGKHVAVKLSKVDGVYVWNEAGYSAREQGFLLTECPLDPVAARPKCESDEFGNFEYRCTAYRVSSKWS